MDASGTYFAMTGKCKTQWYDRSTGNNMLDKKNLNHSSTDAWISEVPNNNSNMISISFENNPYDN